MFVFSAMTARLTLRLPSIALLLISPLFADDPEVFGQKFPKLDGLATGEWWTLQQPREPKPGAKPPKRRPKKMINLNVPRDEVIGFGIYTHDRGVLKLTAQLFPLKPDEAQEVRLEFKRGNKWLEAAREDVMFPGWSAHFRIEKWDNTADVPYRLRHGEKAVFEGLIRKDPIEKDEIVIGNLSCNSSRTSGARPQIVNNLLVHDPVLRSPRILL